MKIVLTGSIGNIGKPLANKLIAQGHQLTIISSHPQRKQTIEEMGAKAAIGSMFDADFLTRTFQGADIVYLMETMEAAGDMMDNSVNFIDTIQKIGENYKAAIEKAAIKKIIHLSSIGAHSNQNSGILIFHYNIEKLLNGLAEDIHIKFIRPVGIYFNMFSFIPTIKSKGKIISNYGGDQLEPWVSPLDIADTIAQEMETPFEGRKIRYVASDLISPNQIARTLGADIGKPDLQWSVITDEELLQSWLSFGMNKQIAEGFIALQSSQRSGKLYEDYYRNTPTLGKVKLTDFALEFKAKYFADNIQEI